METNDNAGTDPLVEDQERAAAEDAAAIGGESSDEGADPERRAVDQAGGGVAEGFEQAEEALIENANHGEGNPLPAAEESRPENIEAQRSTAEYGEPDEADSPDH